MRLFILMLAFVTISMGLKAQDSLRFWADKLDFTVGASVEGYFFNNGFWEATSKRYNKILYGQFNGIVAGNEMKMDAIHPRLGEFSFTNGDILVEAGQTHDMIVRGHTLIWHSQTPGWFNDGEFTRDSLLKIMEHHITTIVSHYKGQITEWDVVNEVIEGDGSLRESKWYTVIGPDYIDSAFVYAHRADPDALLIINDYGAEGINSKSDGLYNVVKGLVDRNIPVNGVGFQAHLTVDDINYASVKKNLKRFNDLGLITNFTEVDIKISQSDFNDEAAWAKQAESFGRLLSMALNDFNSTSFTVWAFSDNDSWIPGHTGGDYGQACPYDFVYREKPAYYAMLDTLKANNGVPVGIINPVKQKQVSIMPNPVQSSLSFTTNCEVVTLSILDSKGCVIKQFSDFASQKTIDVNDLDKGIYILQLKDINNITHTQKFIKN